MNKVLFTVLLTVIGVTSFSQPPVPPLPPELVTRQARFLPPRVHWYSTLATNKQPLVVRETISSNVVCMTIWWENGIAQTNYEVKSTKVVSVVTNTTEIRPE